MTHDRATLKGYFSAGARPNADQFGALIDSTLIMVDEGFEKTDAEGLRILTTGSGNALLSFGRSGEGLSQWRLDFRDNGSDALALTRAPLQTTRPCPPALAFHQTGDGGNAEAQLAANVAIGIARDPGDKDIPARSALDVRGAVRSDGRVGREIILPANGKMHPLTAQSLHGCVAFEVMAGVGLKGSGRFALMHAIAMNTFNPGPWENLFGLKKRIRCQHAYYRRRSDRLKLRWTKSDDPAIDARQADDPNNEYGRDGRFELKIGTRVDYDNPEVEIRAFVTQLWYDPEMSGDRTLDRAYQRLGDPHGQPREPVVP